MSTETASRTAALGALAVTPRPLPQYRDMFALTEHDLLAGPILDCPAGSSPFGAQVRAMGGTVTSVDPAYRMPVRELRRRARADLERITDWQRAYPAGFDWSYLGSPELLARRWTAAIDEFAADRAAAGEHYVPAALPHLPFPDGRFRLALSGFLLFVYPELLGVTDHLAALVELARVTAGEVRVYPLHDTVGTPYPALPALRAALRRRNITSRIRPTGCRWCPYPDSDRMLVLTRR